MDKDAFVQKVKMLCIQKGVKPTNACKESGVGGSFLSDINRGQVPSVERVQMLAAYLGVTTSELLGEEKGPAPVAEGESIYPPEYDLLSPEDKALVDNMIRSLSMKMRENTTFILIPPKDKTDSEMAQSDEGIDREVEDYRRRLILEKNQGDTSSPSNEAGREMA